MGGEGYIRLFVDEGAPLQALLGEFRAWLSHQPTSEQNQKLARYVHKLVDSFGAKPGIASASLERSKRPNLVEPLSARELEVLQLVAAGLSNTQIATRLIVTTGTVKTHINHLFGKLAVQSRTQAVVRARELGLLTG
jgi:LuxR family maltose regulon positive regulatory protein